MPCPKCHSHDLWDDLMWWGCNKCSFMTNSIRNLISPKDRWNETRKDDE